MQIRKTIQDANQTKFTLYRYVGSLTFLAGIILLLLTEVFGINYLWANLVAVSV